jgi:hypothetical protein
MNMSDTNGELVFQNAFVVNDLKAGMKRWHEVNGAGPFHYTEMVFTAEEFCYRGRSSPLSFSMAVGYLGNIQIELVQLHDDTPCAFHDVYKRGQEGMHHIGIIADDYDRTFTRYARQYDVAQSGTCMGMRFVHFDTRRDFGCMIEIIESHPLVHTTRELTLTTARGWDGKEPYRPMTK